MLPPYVPSIPLPAPLLPQITLVAASEPKGVEPGEQPRVDVDACRARQSELHRRLDIRLQVWLQIWLQIELRLWLQVWLQVWLPSWLRKDVRCGPKFGLALY